MGNEQHGKVEIFDGDQERVIIIRVSRLPENASEWQQRLALAEQRSADAERVARDAGQANAEAIRAAVRDEMARLAAEFASRGDAVYGDQRAARADTFHICAERCRELAK